MFFRFTVDVLKHVRMDLSCLAMCFYRDTMISTRRDGKRERGKIVFVCLECLFSAKLRRVVLIPLFCIIPSHDLILIYSTENI
jgi:hypothetical protein